MNAIVATLAIAALLLITETLSAPLANRNTRSLEFFNKFTCLPKQGPTYAKRHWKSCQKIPNHMLPPQTPTYHELDIEERLTQGNSPHLQAPENGYQCFQLDRYTPNFNSRCPAFCKRRDPLKRFCNSPLQRGTSASGSFVIAESPDYNCSPTYMKNVICIYNVSMPCSTSHVQVTYSNINITDNDFVQVIDPTRGQAHQPVSGSSWPNTQLSIPSSQFLLVFWSDKDRTQSKGFKLVMNCPTIDNNSIGSGDQPNLVPSQE